MAKHKEYGKWVDWLNQVEEAVNDGQPLPDEILIANNFPVTRHELEAAFHAAFKQTKNDHGDNITDSWSLSFFKRFWGSLKHQRNLKMEDLNRRQLEHLAWKRKTVMPPKPKRVYHTHSMGTWKCNDCGWEGGVVVSSDSKIPPADAGECKWECGPLVKVDDGLAS
jgi:hypothetical protein